MDQKDQKNFHRDRRFAIVNGILHIAPENLIGTHKDWFRAEGWLESDPELIEHIVRGIVDQGGIHFYTGRDFRCPDDPEGKALPFVAEIAQRLGLDPQQPVSCGLSAGIPGEKLVPTKDYGKIINYIKS